MRRILTLFRARGWRDVDDAALALARELARGTDPKDIVISQEFLRSNAIKSSAVVGALEGEFEPSEGEASVGQTFDATALVLTALSVEFDAMVPYLTDRQTVRLPSGTRYEVGFLSGDHLMWRVAVSEIAAGNMGTAVEATGALEEFQADVLMFVGVAGSLKTDVPVGAIVIPSHIYYYESRKALEDGDSTRPVGFPTPHRLNQLATSVARSWRQRGHPVIVNKPLAAGEAVVGSSRSALAALLRERFNDAVAVDMESAGLYQAAHRQGRVLPLTVRAISDQLDDKSPESDTANQSTAAASAAAFAADLLRNAQVNDVLDPTNRRA